MNRMSPVTACLLLCVLVVAAPESMARQEARWSLAQAADIGADQAAAIARGTTGGRVLGVRRVEQGRGATYEVKVLLEGGLVRTVRVDAATGAVF